jgi:polyhydroxybutyrate depolymerase
MDIRRGAFLAWVGAVFVAVLGCVFMLLASAVLARAAQVGGATTTPAAASTAAKATTVLGPGDHDLTLPVGGYERSYRLHVPTKFSATYDKLLPVVVMLHGAGGSGAQSEEQTGWGKKADQETFVAVFPDALPARPRQAPSFRTNPRFWNDGSGRGSPVHDRIDDAAFLHAVLDDVEKRLPIDKKREFVTGFSSGASMTLRAAIKMSDRIAAAAPVAGHFWPPDAAPETAAPRAVPLLLVYGDKDPLNPWEGGAVKMSWANTDTKPRVMATVNAWAKFSGCPPTPAPIADTNGVKRVAYGPGRDGAEFVFVTVQGMGHSWPGGREVLPVSVVGPRSNKINATDAIWEFFARHYLAVRSVAADPNAPPPSTPVPDGKGKK